MKKINLLRTTLTLLSLVLALSVTSCSKKQKSDDGAESDMSSSSDLGDMSDSDSGRAMGLQTVTFPYDSNQLDSKAKATLSENAKILQSNGSVRVQVEGHCDERGGIQYNIALGERRASAVKSYLVDKGIASDRLSIISYGKEKPMNMGHDEAAWAQNRRANFRITEK